MYDKCLYASTPGQGPHSNRSATQVADLKETLNDTLRIHESWGLPTLPLLLLLSPRGKNKNVFYCSIGAHSGFLWIIICSNLNLKNVFSLGKEWSEGKIGSSGKLFFLGMVQVEV